MYAFFLSFIRPVEVARNATGIPAFTAITAPYQVEASHQISKLQVNVLSSLQHFLHFISKILRISYFSVSLQGPKSEDDIGDGAEADEADELSGYEPESDVNTMTVQTLRFTNCYFPWYFWRECLVTLN